MINLKVSVIMPSYLENYPNCATNRVYKFNRAVNSFLNQTYKNSELIIISDGCDKTMNEAGKYLINENIKLFKIPKQVNFSGNVRSFGIDNASGDIICYLDSDDMFGSNHIKNIVDSYNNTNNECDWLYYNDFIVQGINPTTNEVLSYIERNVNVQYGSIGTTSITHKNIPNEFNWQNCDDYAGDWKFVTKMLNTNRPYQKMQNCEYYVCHLNNGTVDF